MKHIVFVEIPVSYIDRDEMEDLAFGEYDSVNDIYNKFDPLNDRPIRLCGICEHIEHLNNEEYPSDSWTTFVYLNHPATSEYGINFSDTRE